MGGIRYRPAQLLPNADDRHGQGGTGGGGGQPEHPPAIAERAQEYYGTNNDAFVLRCTVERTGTYQYTLWLWLRKHAAGPIFDWFRKLYREMIYSAHHEGNKNPGWRHVLAYPLGNLYGGFASGHPEG